MNYSMIRYLLFRVLEFLGLFLLLPCFIAGIYTEKEGFSYAAVAGVCLLAGEIGKQFKPKSNIFYAREGFVAVALSWIVLSLIGAVPFCLTGEIPSYVDAVFETVSGLTTTGGSILTDVEALSRCSQFWRLFTHWIGGMGVLVLILAVLPLSGSYNVHLMRAESPGPSVGKLVPKVKSTAMILYSIYIIITLIGVVALWIAGLDLYSALTLTFSTVGTGGFGLLNDSIASYSTLVRSIFIVLMIACGMNFNVYYLLLIKRDKEGFKNEEVRGYLFIIALATVLITWNIHDRFPSVLEALHHALFQVASIITTTGFSSLNYDVWPQFSKGILFALTLIGACAGSTGGGFKVSRLLVLFKSVKNELSYVIHPRSIKKIRLDGHTVSNEVIKSIRIYVMIYVLVYITSFLIISIDDFSFTTNITAVAATLNNVGPGLEMVGPAGNYAAFSDFSKLVLMFDMLTGRLELLPMLVLFAPSTWKK